MRLLSLHGDGRRVDVFCLGDENRKAELPIGREFGTQSQDVCDLLFALSKPVRIVVQEIPAVQAVQPKFVSEEVAAEDYPHEFARVSAPLRGSQHNVARNVVRVLDEPIGKCPVLFLGKAQIQVFDAEQDHRTKKAERRIRGDNNVPPLCGRLLVTDDTHVLIEKLSAI